MKEPFFGRVPFFTAGALVLKSELLKYGDSLAISGVPEAGRGRSPRLWACQSEPVWLSLPPREEG